MKISDVLTKMSKLYLNRVLNSFSKDIHKLNENGMRDFINKNIKEITDKSHIEAKLDFSNYSHRNRLLMDRLLRFFLAQSECTVEDSELFENFSRHLKDKNKLYKRKDIFNSIPKRKTEIITTVFEVILEDESMSIDEEKIIRGLKRKLDLTEVEFFAILHKIKSVDKEFNPSNSEIDENLKELQNLGLVYYMGNNVKKRRFIIPEEICDVLVKHYNYPLTRKSFELLFDNFSKDELTELMRSRNLPVSVTKNEMIKTLFERGYNPQKLLDEINKESLSSVAKKIEGIKSSSTKDKLINALLKNYYYLNTNPVESGKVSNESLWEYFVNFAERDYSTLRQLSLISKDLEIEHRFEDLTKYAFTKLMNVKASKFKGNNNPDGLVTDSSGDVLMWDNKSQESKYAFPLSHQKQFIQYVVQAKSRPTTFLIITGKLGNKTQIEKTCIKLSAETGVNFSVVSAEVFKAFVDDISNNREIDLQTFNHNGVLTAEILNERFSALS